MDYKTAKSYFSNLETTSVLAAARYAVPTLLTCTLLVYALVFLPLSYVDSTVVIRQVFRSTVYVISLSFILAGIVTLKNCFVRKSAASFSLLMLLGFWLVLGIEFNLEALGFAPIGSFIPVWLLLTTYVIAFSLVYIDLLLRKYQSYLPRVLNFVEAGTLLFLVVSLYYAVRQGRVLLEIDRDDWISGFALLAVVKVLAALYLIKLVRSYIINIRLNDERVFSGDTIVVFALTAIVEILSFITTRTLDFWWIASFAFLTTMFYVAQSPTKRKSDFAFYSGFVFLILVLIARFVNLNQLSGMTLSVVTGIGGLVGFLSALITIAEFMGITKKGKRFKKRTSRITKRDVEQACSEIISVDGYSIESLNRLMNIVTLSNNVRVARQLLPTLESNVAPELFTYFYIYLVCVEFAANKVVVVKDVAEDGSMVEQTITDEAEFKRYLSGFFPKYVYQLELWNAYANNSYIKSYIRKERLLEAKPPTLTKQIKKAFTLVVTVLVLLSFGLGQVPGSLLTSVPAFGAKAMAWNRFRVTDLKLKMTEAFEPYAETELRDYYASNIYAWLREWRSLQGIYRNGTTYLDEKDLKKLLHWVQLDLKIHAKKDNLHQTLEEEAVILSAALDDCANAAQYSTGAISESEDTNRKDFVLFLVAKCYYESDNAEKSIQLIGDANPSYQRSRALLAEIYLANGNYDKALAAIESGAFEGELVSTSNALATLISAERNYKDKAFDKSAEFGYTALSQMLMERTVLTRKASLRQVLEDFKSSIDAVSAAKPDDKRIDLWYFTYYFYAGHYAEAFRHFAQHVKKSSDYDRKFTRYVQDLVEEIAREPKE